MAKPEWRGRKELEDPRRKYIRKNCPEGEKGFVAEDLDLVLRRFDFNGPDREGRFRLVELKVAYGVFKTSQQRTFGLLDKVLKNSNELGKYAGFYIVYSETEFWDELDQFTVNGWDLTKGQFNEWLNWNLDIEPINPNGNIVRTEIYKWHRGPLMEGSSFES